jgi:hypothetical protein
MENPNHKIISLKADEGFVVTDSFLKLIKKLKSLKNTKGRIILVIGAPGTGKSSNIYHALDVIDLNYYEPILLLDSVNKSSKEVYIEIYNVLGKDLHVETEDEVYKKLSNFDAVLIADKFLDSELLDNSKIGLAEWTNHKTILSIPFFLLWIIEAIRHRKSLKNINLVFQTAWSIQIRGFKYDLITDFGLFSTLLLGILKMIFEVVEIAYTEDEVIQIVKSHNKYINEKEINFYIKKYGNKPRFILDDLENKSLTSKTKKINDMNLKSPNKSK